MGLIQLKSTSPALSWVIQKNPETGMILKPIRKGTAFGFFSKNSEQEYNIYFVDGIDEVSFKRFREEEFEYVSNGKYNSPLMYLNMIDDFLKSAYKKDSEFDKTGEDIINTIVFSQVEVKYKRLMDFMNLHFQEYHFDFSEKVNNNYRVAISTKGTIKELLNMANVLLILIGSTNRIYVDYSDDALVKYIECLNVIDAPYYIRYMFKLKTILSRKIFKEHKAALENSRRYNIVMKNGDTWGMRKTAIENQMEMSGHIIDVGCGEGRYIQAFAGRIKDHKYFAIDIDPEELEKAKKRAERKALTNVEFFDSFSSFVEQTKGEIRGQVILTEVIEHMPLEDAKAFVNQVLESKVATKLIITTPCSEFNQFYFDDDDQMRHDDHDFELTREEFQSFINEANIEGYEPFFFDIGDKVNDIPISQGCVLKLNES